MLPFWCLVLLGGLLPPSQGLLNLRSVLGLSPVQPKDGLLGTGLLGSEGLISGKGGLLDTGLLGEGGLLGTGLLGSGSPSGKESESPLDAGNKSSRSGVLGTGLLGGQPGSSGLLSTGILGGEGLGNGLLGGEGLANGLLGGKGLVNGVLGEKVLGNGLLGEKGLGNGLLGGKGLVNGLLGNGLLGNKSLLGEKGLLGTGLLGKGGLLGNGSLLDLDGLLGGGLLGEGGLLGGGLLGEGVPHTSTRFAWLKALNLENIRVSWKVLRGSEIVLNLYSKLVFRLPGIFHFLSGSSVETNITSHIALTQDTPGDLKLVIKDCRNLLGGFTVNLRKGLLTNLVSNLLNSSLQTLVPALLCPLVNIWVSIINIKLQFLNRVISFGLLGKIYSVLSNLPVTSGQFVELDLQKSPFPSVFIDWLLQTTGIDPGSIP
uniref:Lipid-binding serum glycoprotein N-terminal domain-containing protein n=1 Tax=Otus sunia TaxID=257818 RepID=A0A8C8A6N6_9STRI